MIEISNPIKIVESLNNCRIGMPVAEQQVSGLQRQGDFEFIELSAPSRRTPTGPEDWGDQQTVGVFVKTKSHEAPRKFGRYLGESTFEGSRVYLVGLIADRENEFTALQAFPSTEEMKKIWWLD